MAAATKPSKVKSVRVKEKTTRMRPETNSREAQIQMLVATGLDNGAIWAALEKQFPQVIPNGDQRRTDKKNPHYIKDCPDYDADERGRISRALNSTRALAIKDDERVMSIVEATGGLDAQAKRLDELDMLNRHRFSWGETSLDFIYGQTKYLHLSDHPNSKYETREKKINSRDEKGVVTPKTIKSEIWVKGSWKAGDPMIPDGKDGFITTRNPDGSMVDNLDLTQQLIEHGCPEAFMSIWGGEPGVGKTKLAVKAGKLVNQTTLEPILYINGEATEEDFRTWVGSDADPDLFRVLTANMIPVQRVCDLAYQIRPRVIFIDSVQTLAEWDKGNRGQKSALMILRNLKADVRAGKPHIVLISQLNKDNELKGSRDLEHLADMVASVTKEETKKGVFLFECRRKNRGGETPRGALFKHTPTSIECISSTMRSVPFKLEQPSSPIIAAGVVDPTPPPPAEEQQDVEAAA